MKNREVLQKRLSDQGIPTAVHYPVPLNEQPAYKHLCCPDCTPIASKIAKQVMSLPMGAELSSSDQDKVIATLKDAEV
jgi:UDP-2-acetamido-2-deoxy-ribo-hexuluronate aminotransferase